MIRTSLVAVAMALVVVACQQVSGSEPPRDERWSAQRSLTYQVEAPVRARFTGTHEMAFFERTTTDPTLSNLRLATISTKMPIEFEPGRGLIVGISLVGSYHGPGTYDVHPRDDAQPAPGEVPDLSVIRMEVYDLTAPIPTLVESWDNPAVCRVSIGSDASTGTLRCPARGSDGSFVIEMAWGAR